MGAASDDVMDEEMRGDDKLMEWNENDNRYVDIVSKDVDFEVASVNIVVKKMGSLKMNEGRRGRRDIF